MSDVTFRLVDETTVVQIVGDTGLIAPFAAAASASAAAALASENAAAASAESAAEEAQDAAASADASEAARDLAIAASQTAPNVYASTAAGLAAVGEGITFWVDAGGGAIDLYRDVGGVATYLGRSGSKHFRTLTSYGAVSDANMIDGGAMTSGQPTLTIASGPFTAADVGKSILVAGAGAAGVKLKTTIAGYTSATVVTLATNAGTTVSSKGVAWGTDASAALSAALSAADGDRGGTIIVDGYFLLMEPVTEAFFASVTSSYVRLLGAGTNSALIVAVDANETALTLSSVTADLDGITFVGVPDATDALRVLYLNGVTARVTNCQFLGLLTTDQTVRASASRWKSESNHFGGSFILTDLIGPAPARSVLYLDDWYSFEDQGSQFIDYGYWRGLSLGKSGSSTTSAWVGLGTPNTTYTVAGTRAAGIATFNDTQFDEGSLKGVWAEPASGTITSLELVGTRHNVNDVIDSSGVCAASVVNVLIDRCAFGLAPSPGTAFGRFEDCDRVVLDSLTLLQSVDTVVTSSVGALIVRDTEIDNYDLTGTAFYPESSLAGGLALVKDGTISDADFPVSPGTGARAFDRDNGRLYIRAGGDWVYFNMDGGSLLGPELVTNGTLAGGTTTGWTARASTLSVVSGKLRVTNTGIYGVAKQSVAVGSATSLLFSVSATAGTAGVQVRLGSTEEGGEYYVGSDPSVTFTPAGSTVWVTLIASTETVGAYTDYDNISMKAA